MNVIEPSREHADTQTSPSCGRAARAADLVCNIPEHHSLEDMVHKNQATIQRLRSGQGKPQGPQPYDYCADELVLLERRAEFEALDLAIGHRRQQLLQLEMASRGRRFGHRAR